MQRENVAPQAFAAEVFKRDPKLYCEAMVAARRFVETRKRAWHERTKRGELEAHDAANAVVGMMQFWARPTFATCRTCPIRRLPGRGFIGKSIL
ncbi:conserved hypothetical protein [Roseibium sp. TrichSKD4]|uniref:hypothetical protein n=1 Tax=Roseibium sp. TrichSKD4 TaxID=744980 RepID=UPI0001E569A4|nr:hypothetical protein [Roseibium sp. TrichSKD4]EFO30640.1 conserved hypothetical protein [Roseibium sp. TrichSKD4]